MSDTLKQTQLDLDIKTRTKVFGACGCAKNIMLKKCSECGNKAN